MITVRLLGHIRTEVGRGVVTIEVDRVEASELVDRVRGMAGSEDPGFNKYNTLVMIEDGEAFVPASRGKILIGGARVILIPFSHGG